MRKLSLFASLGSAAVAMIILVDIATAQGPPALNSFIYSQPINQPIQEYRPIPAQFSTGFVPRPEYQEIKKAESAYGGEFQKVPYQGNYNKEHEKEHEKNHHHHHQHHKEAEKHHNKEHEKGGEYEKEYNKEKGESSPGMFSSLTNSMSKAWSNLG